MRELAAEFRISIEDMILPYFVVGGKNKKEKIPSMPGIYRLSIDYLLKDLDSVQKLGIPGILLFGIPPEQKLKTENMKPLSEVNPAVYSKNGIVQRALYAIKKRFPELVLITDVCLCGYTAHGHCGIVKIKNHTIDNDSTIEILAKVALSHAESGADIVAPSAMMDGEVLAIRKTLDKNGFDNVAIMGYSAKYASSFYGPFREAAGSSPRFGDRKSYQMDYRNLNETIREVDQDIKEGADIVMVKPALAYLDVIRAVKESSNVPLAAYSVSGEYSMVKAASEKGWLEEKKAVLEILTSIKRAGADIIITYWAKDVAKWLK